MEQYRERKRKLHIVLIDLEKADNTWGVLWRCFEARGVLGAYLRAIKDMNDGAKSQVRTVEGESNHFLVAIGLHQESTLNPFLFSLCWMN